MRLGDAQGRVQILSMSRWCQCPCLEPSSTSPPLRKEQDTWVLLRPAPQRLCFIALNPALSAQFQPHSVSAPSFNQNKKWPPWQSLWTDCRNRNRAFHSDAHHYLIQQPVGIKISCCQNLFFFGWRPKSFLSPVGSVTPCPHTVIPGGSARMWKQWSSAGTSLNHSFFSWFPELLFQSSSRELILMF